MSVPRENYIPIQFCPFRCNTINVGDRNESAFVNISRLPHNIRPLLKLRSLPLLALFLMISLNAYSHFIRAQ